MSKHHCKKEVQYQPVVMPRVDTNCCCSFPLLIVLILIVLQFSKGCDSCCEDTDCCCDKHEPIGKGILFIIALFFLACCNPCKPGFGAGFGGGLFGTCAGGC